MTLNSPQTRLDDGFVVGMVPSNLATVLVPCFTASSVAPWRYRSPVPLPRRAPAGHRPPAAAQRSHPLTSCRAVFSGLHAALSLAGAIRPALRGADAGVRWLQVCARVWRAPVLCGSVRVIPPPRRPCATAGRGPCTGDEKGAWRRPGTTSEPARARPAVPRCAATLRCLHARRWVPGVIVSTARCFPRPLRVAVRRRRRRSRTSKSTTPRRKTGNWARCVDTRHSAPSARIS